MLACPPQRRPGQDQNLALQLDALKKVGCHKIYQEKISGASVERPDLGRVLKIIREGDTLVIWKLDRLGRSLVHLVQLVTELERRQVGLLSLNDPVYTTTAQGRLVFRIFASLAEFDRTGEPAGGDSGAYFGWFSLRPSTGSTFRPS